MGYVIRDDQFWPTTDVMEGHTAWRSSAAEAGGGALLEHSIHSCDIACWLFGPVTRVYARTRHVFGYDVEDTAALTIEHASGVVGTLLTIFNGVIDREERRIEVFLEQAAIEATTDFVVGAPEDSLLVKERSGPAERIDTAALCRESFVRDGVDVDRPFYVYQYLAHRAFARSLAAGTPPSPGVRDTLAAHQLVEAAYRSTADRPAGGDRRPLARRLGRREERGDPVGHHGAGPGRVGAAAAEASTPAGGPVVEHVGVPAVGHDHVLGLRCRRREAPVVAPGGCAASADRRAEDEGGPAVREGRGCGRPGPRGATAGHRIHHDHAGHGSEARRGHGPGDRPAARVAADPHRPGAGHGLDHRRGPGRLGGDRNAAEQEARAGRARRGTTTRNPRSATGPRSAA